MSAKEELTAFNVFRPKEMEAPGETFMRELWVHLDAEYCEWGYGVNQYVVVGDGKELLKKAQAYCDKWNELAGKYLYVQNVSYKSTKEKLFTDEEYGEIKVEYTENLYPDDDES